MSEWNTQTSIRAVTTPAAAAASTGGTVARRTSPGADADDLPGRDNAMHADGQRRHGDRHADTDESPRDHQDEQGETEDELDRRETVDQRRPVAALDGLLADRGERLAQPEPRHRNERDTCPRHGSPNTTTAAGLPMANWIALTGAAKNVTHPSARK